MFSIGDTVYIGKYTRVTSQVPCPDCAGQRFLTVTLGNGDQHTIECACCLERRSWGADYPRGWVEHVELSATTTEATISGVSVTTRGIEYETSAGRAVHEGYDPDWGGYPTARATTEEAVADAEAGRIEAEESENRRKFSKDKEGKTWSWHVTYHRQCLKRAQEQIEYHTGRLNYAAEVVKRQKKEGNGV